MSYPYDPPLLVFPEPEEGEEPTAGIKPGYYDQNGLVELLREHAENPEAIRYIADMLEV